MFHLCFALVSTIVYKLYLLDSFHNSGVLDFHHHGSWHNILGHECCCICSGLAFLNGTRFGNSIWLIELRFYVNSHDHFLCCCPVSFTTSLTVSYSYICIRPHLLHLFHFTSRITPPEEQQAELWWNPMLKGGLCSHTHKPCVHLIEYEHVTDIVLYYEVQNIL